MDEKALPSISLVTCSYQQARFLDATIRSVLDQAYPKLQYIVADGGSTDGSLAIIERHASALSWWVSERDRGQSHALIKGFAQATGDICGWLCSDDLLLPGALNAVATFFHENPEIQAAFGDSIWIDIDGNPIRPKREMGFNRFVFLHDHNYVPQPSMFWRRSLYKKVGGIRPYYSIAMDNDLWERFSAVTAIGHIPKYLSCMRHYSEQKTLAGKWKKRGRREGSLVTKRGSRFARHRCLRPVLHEFARTLRIISKCATGSYWAQVPADVLLCLQRYQTPALSNWS